MDWGFWQLLCYSACIDGVYIRVLFSHRLIKMTPEMQNSQRWKKVSQHWDWIVVAIVILIAAATRVHLLGVPMERDEGEYAYAGQLILQGIPPYAQVYNM